MTSFVFYSKIFRAMKDEVEDITGVQRKKYENYEMKQKMKSRG